jgi:hypothetical protein
LLVGRADRARQIERLNGRPTLGANLHSGCSAGTGYECSYIGKLGVGPEPGRKAVDRLDAP